MSRAIWDNDELQTEATPRLIQDLIADAIGLMAEEDSLDVNYKSFREAGVMTNDNGLVLTIGKKQFQVTIVQSKGARG